MSSKNHGSMVFGHLEQRQNNTKKGLTKNNKSQFEESFDYSPQARSSKSTLCVW